MNDLLINYLSTVNPPIILAAVMICFLCFWTLFKNRGTISDFFNNFYQRKQSRQKLLATIQENQAAIKTIIENRVHDREQSFAIQKELTDAQKELAQSLFTISEKIDAMQAHTDKRFQESEQKNNKRIRAELKDKISRSYRYYHSIGKINDMELEALEDLIEEYEAADGQNSFVHSVVQKEMYAWEKVDKI